MGDRRPPIPRPLERDLLVEAGHRCAIPTCSATSGLQFHHIVPWGKIKEHSFDNLIVLCAICHARVTNREIDTKAVRAYKENLGILRSRYNDQELRFLEMTLAASDEMRERDPNLPQDVRVNIPFPSSRAFDFWYLLRDGMVTEVFHDLANGQARATQAVEPPGAPGVFLYPFTEIGARLLQRFRDGDHV